MKRLTRRQLIARSTAAGFAVVSFSTLLSGCARSASACVDPDMLSTGERQMRQARQYVDASSHDDKQCRGCSFFKPGAAEAAACGDCEILSGPVSTGGHCNYWAKRSS